MADTVSAAELARIRNRRLYLERMRSMGASGAKRLSRDVGGLSAPVRAEPASLGRVDELRGASRGLFYPQLSSQPLPGRSPRKRHQRGYDKWRDPEFLTKTAMGLSEKVVVGPYRAGRGAVAVGEMPDEFRQALNDVYGGQALAGWRESDLSRDERELLTRLRLESSRRRELRRKEKESDDGRNR